MIFGLACRCPNAGLDKIDLSSEAPFGLKWEATDHYAVDESECRDIITSLAPLFRNEDAETALSACLADQTSTVFLPRDENPEWFQEGGISVTLLGGTLPVSYSYSYLHNLNRETPIQNKHRREAHAKEIRKALTHLYGRPTARGKFEELSEFGFVVSKQPNQPCDFWLINSYGILLCSERVIYLDGFEMSLSFTRLDRVENRDGFLDMLAGNQGSDTLNFNAGFALDDPSKSSVREKLRAASKFVDPGMFRSCDKSDLKPFSEIFENSAADDVGLAKILTQYSGDDLANYVFENYDTLETEAQRFDQDTSALLLLKSAANQGSALGLNELGASSLYCYLGVERDIEAATDWLNRAAASGDQDAMASLARIHLLGLSGLDQDKALALSLELLSRCSDIDPDACEADFAALTTFNEMLSGSK